MKYWDRLTDEKEQLKRPIPVAVAHSLLCNMTGITGTLTGMEPRGGEGASNGSHTLASKAK
jgi:hypothetical protein